jgi:hypothetical protein
MRIRLGVTLTLFSTLAHGAPLMVLNAPGAKTTCGTSIASNGLVAGVVSSGQATSERGFLFQNGVFIYPGVNLASGSVFFSGVNRYGTITGSTLYSASISVGNFLVRNGVTSMPTVSLGPVQTLTGISDSGALLGTVGRPPSNQFPFGTFAAGFQLARNGATTLIDDGSGSASPLAQDETGQQIVGTSFSHAWIYSGGKFTTLNDPVAGALTFPHGVDAQGRISGSYYVSTAPNVVAAHGFLLRGGTYRTWDVPGAIWTQILGANGRGQITGCFKDTHGIHGFVATP